MNPKALLAVMALMVIIPSALAAVPQIPKSTFPEGFCDYYTSYRHQGLCMGLEKSSFKFQLHPWTHETMVEVSCQDDLDCYNNAVAQEHLGLEFDLQAADNVYSSCLNSGGTPRTCEAQIETYRAIEEDIQGLEGDGNCIQGLVGSVCCPDEFAEFQASCADIRGPEVCNDGFDNDADGFIDCDDPDCLGNEKCMFVVSGIVKSGRGEPLQRVKVGLFDENDALLVEGYTDESGAFSLDYSDLVYDLDIPEYEPTVYLAVMLTDEEGRIAVIWDYGLANEAYYASTVDFTIPTGRFFDITMRSDNELMYVTSKITEYRGWDSHWDASLIYYDAIRALDFIEDELGYTFKGSGNSFPLYIYIYTPRAESAYYMPPYGTSAGGIFISPRDSRYDAPDCPENCIWHEIFHFVMQNKYNTLYEYSETNVNHEGFKNDRTDDSYSEGFAEFWPNILDLKLNKNGDTVYGGIWNMEVNYDPWVHEGTYEEFGVASILWDLYDSSASEDDRGEAVSLPYTEIWNVLMEKRLKSIDEVYDALTDRWPEQKESIDDIFINHGFFKSSVEGNGIYDAGEPFWDLDPDGEGSLEPNGIRESNEEFIDIGTPEGSAEPVQEYVIGDEIGTPSNYERPLREKKPLNYRSFVKVGVEGRDSDEEVSDALFKVSYSFSDSSLDYDSYGIVDPETGYIYIEVPPIGYEMTATITVDNYEGSGESIVTSEDYYSGSWREDGYIKSDTISVGQRKENYCNNNRVCEYVEVSSCGDCRESMSLEGGDGEGDGGAIGWTSDEEQMDDITGSPQPDEVGDSTAFDVLIVTVFVIILFIAVIIAAIIKSQTEGKQGCD